MDFVEIGAVILKGLFDDNGKPRKCPEDRNTISKKTSNSYNRKKVVINRSLSVTLENCNNVDVVINIKEA
jgi:hypothetical protein